MSWFFKKKVNKVKKLTVDEANKKINILEKDTFQRFLDLENNLREHAGYYTKSQIKDFKLQTISEIYNSRLNYETQVYDLKIKEIETTVNEGQKLTYEEVVKDTNGKETKIKKEFDKENLDEAIKIYNKKKSDKIKRREEIFKEVLSKDPEFIRPNTIDIEFLNDTLNSRETPSALENYFTYNFFETANECLNTKILKDFNYKDNKIIQDSSTKFNEILNNVKNNNSITFNNMIQMLEHLENISNEIDAVQLRIESIPRRGLKYIIAGIMLSGILGGSIYGTVKALESNETTTPPNINKTTPPSNKTTTPSPSSDLNILSEADIAIITNLVSIKVSGCYMYKNNGGKITATRLEGCSEWYNNISNQILCSCTGMDCNNQESCTAPYCLNQNSLCQKSDAKKCTTSDNQPLQKCNGQSINEDGFVFYAYQYFPPDAVLTTAMAIIVDDEEDSLDIVKIVITAIIILLVIFAGIYILTKSKGKKGKSKKS